MSSFILHLPELIENLQKYQLTPRHDKIKAVIMRDSIIDSIIFTISVFLITLSFVFSFNAIPF